MTVRELKEILNHVDPDRLVSICVNTPSGWVCPDGCTVEVKSAHCGIDWHGNEILLAPMYKLDIHDVNEWAGKTTTSKDEEPKPEPNGKKEPRINGLTILEYVRTMERAHEATKNSKLVFK